AGSLLPAARPTARAAAMARDGLAQGVIRGPYPRYAASHETGLGPTSLKRHIHQRLRPLVAKHPNTIHPHISLVIDAGAPHGPGPAAVAPTSPRFFATLGFSITSPDGSLFRIWATLLRQATTTKGPAASAGLRGTHRSI